MVPGRLGRLSPSRPARRAAARSASRRRCGRMATGLRPSRAVVGGAAVLGRFRAPAVARFCAIAS
eukprot:14645157-Alexandrium_andersonii.AAC.1